MMDSVDRVVRNRTGNSSRSAHKVSKRCWSLLSSDIPRNGWKERFAPVLNAECPDIRNWYQLLFFGHFLEDASEGYSEIQARETTCAYFFVLQYDNMSQTLRHDIAHDGHLSWNYPLIFNQDKSFLPPDDSISMIADAYENDDFWYSASTRSSAQPKNKELVSMAPTPVQLYDKNILCLSRVHQFQNPLLWPKKEQSKGMLIPVDKVEEAKSHSMVNYQLALTALQSTSSLVLGKLPEQAMAKISFSKNKTGKKSDGLNETQSSRTFLIDISSSSDVPTPQYFIAQPLTSYNFFFTYERERLLGSLAHSQEGTNWEIDHYLYSDRWNNKEAILAFQTDLLQKHWSRDRTIKRKHRKTHFRVPFQTLTRQISKNWHSLPAHVKAIFHEVAAKDYRRYQFELQQSRSKNSPTQLSWEASGVSERCN